VDRIRDCTRRDLPAIEAIVNAAAQRYRGAIPADCWHEPYMNRGDLLAALASGVRFAGWEGEAGLVGVMGLQDVRDVTLIRHAYVLPEHQGKGIGGALMRHLVPRASAPLLVGTWAAATWAIRFYESHGFRLMGDAEKDRLLDAYWQISPRQRETSVVLAKAP
jgi:GNAT superfamily N-acetyltransferase